MATRRRKESIVQACASGDERRALEAMRALLAESMDSAVVGVIAQVSGRLQAVIRSISELDERDAAALIAAAEVEVSPVAQLEARRAARKSATSS